MSYFLASLVAFISSFLATLPTIKLAQKLHLVDNLKTRVHPANTHTGTIPRAGGIAIFFGILVAAVFFMPISKLMLGIILGAFLIVLLGLADDAYDLSPYFRFALNILIVGTVILFGLGMPYIGNPLGGIIRLDTVVLTVHFLGTHHFLVLANLLSIIWIVAMMNFVNWSKGVDGQMPGFVAISSLFLGFLAFRFSAHDISAESVATLAFIVSGAFLGFLLFNMYPQKIMPGYGGGALAGFFLGVLSILSFAKLGTLVLVMSVPFVDAIYVILRRLKNRRSPFKGDAGHFHHRLLQIGWGKRRIAVFYWLVSALFGFCALFLPGQEKLLAVIIVAVFLGFFIIVMNKVKARELEK